MPSPDPQIHATPGELPPFWPHRVVFFANLRALFFGNTDETRELCNIVGNVESYGGRLVPVLDMLFRGANNTLILEREPDPVLHRYFRDELALSIPQHHVLPHDDYLTVARALQAGETTSADALLPHIDGWADSVIDGYVTDPTLVAIAERHRIRTICTPEGSWRGNNKLLLHEFLASEGLPVFDTEIVPNHGEIAPALARLEKGGYRRAVIKAQIGASGIGLYRLDLPATAASLAALPEMLFHDGPALVQGWLEPGVKDVTEVHSPSVQMFVGDTTVHLYDITEQILSHESIHEGNEAIPERIATNPTLQKDLLDIAGAAGRWLHAQGYRGLGSADFIVTTGRSGSPHRPILCEINARVTGATYPAVLARKLAGRNAWLMRNVRFREPPESEAILNALRSHGLLFAKGSTSGILPINFNPEDETHIGKAQFLALASTLATCRQIMNSLHDRLPLHLDYDRD